MILRRKKIFLNSLYSQKKQIKMNIKPGIELNFTTKARAHTTTTKKTRANYVIGNNNEN